MCFHISFLELFLQMIAKRENWIIIFSAFRIYAHLRMWITWEWFCCLFKGSVGGGWLGGKKGESVHLTPYLRWLQTILDLVFGGLYSIGILRDGVGGHLLKRQVSREWITSCGKSQNLIFSRLSYGGANTKMDTVEMIGCHFLVAIWWVLYWSYERWISLMC